MTIRLSIHFSDEVQMMEWFETVLAAGGFGSRPHQEFPDHVDVPYTEVGVRHMDSLDKGKVKGSKEFIISGTRDPGRWVELVEDKVMPAHTITAMK